MDKVLELVNWLVQNGPMYAGLVSAALSAIIAICLVIPGEQPEKFLQSVVDFLARFSKKPAEQKSDEQK